MSDTPTPKKRVAKRVAPPPEPTNDDEVFVIEPVIERYRYMFAGGRIMDVSSPYQSNSTDRGKVLAEAHRRWGGKKDDWRIEGSTRLSDAGEPSP